MQKQMKEDIFFPRLMEGFDPLMMAIYKPWLDELGLDVPETTEKNFIRRQKL